MHDFFNIDRGALLYEKTLFERLCKSGYKDVYSTYGNKLSLKCSESVFIR